MSGCALPLAAVLALAAHHAAMAKQYDRQAAAMARAIASKQTEAERLDREAAERGARYSQARDYLAGALAEGLPPAAAVQRAAAAAGIAPATLQIVGRQARMARRDVDRFAREIEIMRLAARGRSNVEIGRDLGLHPGSVSRVLRRRLGPGRAPDGSSAADGAAGRRFAGNQGERRHG